jgi:hypothetical protein
VAGPRRALGSQRAAGHRGRPALDPLPPRNPHPRPRAPARHRLIKKCVLVNRELRGADKAHQLPLSLVQGVLEAQGAPLDMDELECVVANLVVREAVKGYIAHKQKVLVVSKDAAFPPPSALWWQDPF